MFISYISASPDKLAQCLKTYPAIGKQQTTEESFWSQVVTPYMDGVSPSKLPCVILCAIMCHYVIVYHMWYCIACVSFIVPYIVCHSVSLYMCATVCHHYETELYFYVYCCVTCISGSHQ